jgi:chromate transporter
VPRPSLRKLAGVFLRVSNTTFGGGYVTMAALGREMVDIRSWLTAEDYALAYALAGVTPGTNVIAFCAAVGWQVLGWMGAVAGVLTLTLPTAVLAVLILQGFESGASHPLVAGALAGTVAAVSGMMWSTVWLLVKRYVGRGWNRNTRAAAITLGAFLASWRFGITPVPILAGAAVAGLLWRDRPQEAAAPHAGTAAEEGAAAE